MPKILKPSDVVERLAAGETTEQIFFDASGAYAAKLAGPQAEVSVNSEADRTIDFVITSEAVDRMTDTIRLGGWKTQNYVRNPVVLWAHDDSIPAIGRGTNLRVENGAMRSTAAFATREVYPLADTIYQLVLGKFIGAASVGFIPLKATAAKGKDRPFGLDIIEQELLEWSVVNIPANPECLTQARSVGIDCQPLIGWAECILDKGGMLLIPRAELEALRKAAGAPTLVAARTFTADEVMSIFKVDPKKLEALGENITMTGKSAPERKVKSLWHVAWLADILMDLDILEDCVEWEAAVEEDGSPIPQQLTDALKALGQILIDMTIEEVTELLAEEDADEAMPLVDVPMEAAARTAARMRLLKLLVKADDRVLCTVIETLKPKAAGGLVDLLAVKGAIESALKAGKVLSGANETALRSACDHMTKAMDHVNGVIGANQADDGDDEDVTKSTDESERERRARARKHKSRASLQLVAAE
jgi:hypothetical protein